VLLLWKHALLLCKGSIVIYKKSSEIVHNQMDFGLKPVLRKILRTRSFDVVIQFSNTEWHDWQTRYAALKVIEDLLGKRFNSPKHLVKTFTDSLMNVNALQKLTLVDHGMVAFNSYLFELAFRADEVIEPRIKRAIRKEESIQFRYLHKNEIVYRVQ